MNNKPIKGLIPFKTSQEGGLLDKVKFIENLMIGIVIVLFIGFLGIFVAVGTMAIESWNHRADSYSNLQDEVMTQNIRIETLIYELRRGNGTTTPQE